MDVLQEAEMTDELKEIQPETGLFRFKSDTGELTGDPLNLSLKHNLNELTLICQAVLKQEDPTPFLFFIDDTQITSTLQETLDSLNIKTGESVIYIVYQPQAVFRVRPVTRCTSSMPGHAEAVVSLSFSPDGKHLASGSGDTTVRLWDISTQTPHFTCKGHKDWVLVVAWSPNSRRLATACRKGNVIIWDPFTGQQVGKTMIGHKQYVTSLSWEPYHKNVECRLLASSSKDRDIRIWDTVLGRTILTLAGHTDSVSSVKWGGSGLIYSASHDRTVKVWRAKDGVLCRTLQGHAHWVNKLALNTDYILRIGAFDPIADSNKDTLSEDKTKSAEFALKRYHEITEAIGERLVSCSDDCTLFLWNPEKESKPLARLTGHLQLVFDVKFSPDSRIIASASSDKSVKLWQAKTGKFVDTLRGHVQAVYLVAFSADSRLLVSASADSTVKVWNLTTRKLLYDLPGHADEVYAVDWSTDGFVVASGGKDKVLKLWQN